MANLWAEGFEQYQNGPIIDTTTAWAIDRDAADSVLRDYWNFVTTSVGTELRFGGTVSNSNVLKFIMFTTLNMTSGVVGYAIVNENFQSVRNGELSMFLIGSSGVLQIGRDTSGNMQIKRRNNINSNVSGTVYDAGFTYTPNVRAYVEIVFTSGSHIDVYVNNILRSQIDFTDIGTVLSVGFGSTMPGAGSGWGNISPARIDDIYINDLTGAAPLNNRLGEISVVTLFPDGDETPADWAIEGAATGWEALSNVPADPAEYIESATVGDISAFSIEAPPAIYQIMTVRSVVYAEKTASGDCDIRSIIVQAGDDAAGASFALAEGTYGYYTTNFPVDPSTGDPWNPLTFDPIIQYERTL